MALYAKNIYLLSCEMYNLTFSARSLLALSFLALGFLPIGALGETREVILVAGQSNAVGFDAYAEELPANADDVKTMFWWRVGDPPPDEFDSTSAR